MFIQISLSVECGRKGHWSSLHNLVSNRQSTRVKVLQGPKGEAVVSTIDLEEKQGWCDQRWLQASPWGFSLLPDHKVSLLSAHPFQIVCLVRFQTIRSPESSPPSKCAKNNGPLDLPSFQRIWSLLPNSTEHTVPWTLPSSYIMLSVKKVPWTYPPFLPNHVQMYLCNVLNKQEHWLWSQWCQLSNPGDFTLMYCWYSPLLCWCG